MEALATFSIACNVMQTIQFGFEAVTLCKNIYTKSVPAPDIEYRRNGLQNATQNLQNAIVSIPTAAVQEEERQLQQVARDLVGTAQELEEELRKCGMGANNSRLTAMGKAAEYLARRKSRIEKLNASLQSAQSVMETRILISLRNKAELNYAETHRSFEGMDRQLQDFMRHLQDGHLTLAQLIDEKSGQVKDMLREEGNSTRLHVTVQSQRIQDAIADTNRYINGASDAHVSATQLDRFMRSLEYPEMNARKTASAINTSFEGTFRWIFEDERKGEVEGADEGAEKNKEKGAEKGEGKDEEKNEKKDEEKEDDSDEEGRPTKPKPAWNSFIKWLASDDSIFWISGKPGSGKSCLIRYLTTEPRTRMELQKWRTGAELHSIFIWSAGSPKQRSQIALLATLLHQLLSADPSMAQELLASPAMQQKSFINDWDLSELMGCILQVLKREEQPVCVFIDGLDEIAPTEFDGPHGLLQLVNTLAALPNTKLCLGSREDPIFVDALSQYPKLRLQDLNDKDIRRYVRQNIKSLASSSRREWKPSQINALGGAIAYRAQGVFLWVRLVMQSIRRGHIASDDIDQLYERIKQLPSELSDLYTDMWMRLNKEDKQIYRAQTALYFKLILESETTFWGSSNRGDTSFLEMLFCADETFRRQILSGGSELTEKAVLVKYEAFERQLRHRCAGLVEIAFGGDRNTEVETAPLINSDARLKQMMSRRTKVSFIHRSVRDFLVDTQEGQQILEQDNNKLVKLAVWRIMSHFVYILFCLEELADKDDRLDIIERLSSLIHALPSQGLELPALDLVRSLLARSPAWNRMNVDTPFENTAASAGAAEYVKRFLKTSVFESPAQTEMELSNLLNWTVLHLSQVQASIAIGNSFSHWSRTLPVSWPRNDSLMTWLLEFQDADPNLPPTARDSRFGRPYHNPLVTFLMGLNAFLEQPPGGKRDPQNRVAVKQLLQSLDKLLEHGAHPNMRVLTTVSNSYGCTYNTYHDNAFGQCWRFPYIRWPDHYKILMVIDICDIITSTRKELSEWIDDVVESQQQRSRLHSFINTEATSQPKVVLKVSLHWDEDGRPPYIISSTSSTSLLGGAVLNKASSFPAFERYASPREMNGEETIAWLVERGYISKDVASSGSPLSIVYGRSLGSGSAGADYSVRDKPFTAFSDIDWSFKPQYDDFVAALEDAALQ